MAKTIRMRKNKKTHKIKIKKNLKKRTTKKLRHTRKKRGGGKKKKAEAAAALERENELKIAEKDRAKKNELDIRNNKYLRQVIEDNKNLTYEEIYEDLKKRIIAWYVNEYNISVEYQKHIKLTDEGINFVYEETEIGDDQNTRIDKAIFDDKYEVMRNTELPWPPWPGEEGFIIDTEDSNKGFLTIDNGSLSSKKESNTDSNNN